ncbi:MAG: response regulator transcription factor [Vicinamibacterales bacterium]
MSDAARILVVDDEPQIRRVLRVTLEAQHFDVRTAADGTAALDLFHDWKPQLVVLDLTMPEEDGLSVTRRIRQESDVPVIILSVKGDEPMKVAALDAGADDYVTKPFGMDELLARVRAALRRSTAPAADRAAARIEAGDFAIDLEARRVVVRGAEVHLTPKEFDLLVHFARHPGRVLTHRALLTAIWGADYASQTEYLRVFVAQLRRKLEADHTHPRYLTTEPWVGYRFDPGP